MDGNLPSTKTLCLKRDSAIIDMRRALMRDDTKAAHSRHISICVQDRSRITSRRNRGFQAEGDGQGSPSAARKSASSAPAHKTLEVSPRGQGVHSPGANPRCWTIRALLNKQLRHLPRIAFDGDEEIHPALHQCRAEDRPVGPKALCIDGGSFPAARRPAGI